VQYRWDELGFLISAEPYEAGLAHGIAKQWHQGQLIGSYTMVHGTGLDLWWQSSDRLIWLSEARYYRDGYRDGFEWRTVPSIRMMYWHITQPEIEREILFAPGP
jgi:hypothetical protein